MPQNLKVIYTAGVPVAADFNASDGAPLCVNRATGIAYYLTSAGVVTAIPPNLDSVGSTQGQILYRGAAAWAALGVGTSGEALVTQGAGANPQWASRGYALQGSCALTNPLDATTYYFGALTTSSLATSATLNRIYLPRAGTLTAVYFQILSLGPGSAETSSVYFRLNNTTDTLISAAVANDASVFAVSNAAMSVAIAAGDYFEFKWITPTWVTDPTLVSFMATAYVR